MLLEHLMVVLPMEPLLQAMLLPKDNLVAIPHQVMLLQLAPNLLMVLNLPMVLSLPMVLNLPMVLPQANLVPILQAMPLLLEHSLLTLASFLLATLPLLQLQ